MFKLYILDFEIRLVGGSATEGRVEVYWNEVWGTVCNDGWDSIDAATVCQYLGITGSSEAVLDSSRFGQGAGDIWLDDVACDGDESSLLGCAHSDWGIHDCGHTNDAAVRCGLPDTSGNTMNSNILGQC